MTGLPAEFPVGRRNTAPQPLDPHRPPDARQPGETNAAYRCFLEYLREGNIRDAAAALGRNRRTLERYSRRWRWPERVRLIVASHAPRWRPLAEYEELHDLPAAKNRTELVEREMWAFTEVTTPRMAVETEAALERMLAPPVEEPPPLDFEEEERIILDRILSRE